MSQTVALQTITSEARKNQQNFTQAVTTCVVALLCALGIGALQLPQLNQLSSSKQTTEVETLKKEINSEKQSLILLRKMPTFGLNNLVSNWVFLKFLQYFGDDAARQKTGYSLSPEYFEVILGRDPHFLQAYLFLSTSTSIYGGMPERSIAIMEKGLKSLSPNVPRSYYIWRYKGTDELLFLGEGEKAKQSFTTAAEWASNHLDEESKNAQAISLATARFLAHNPKSKSAQIAAWTMVFNNPVDKATRKLAISRIEALGGKVSISPQGAMKVTLPKED